jgi:hypothetical protein
MTVRAYDPALGRFISHDPLGRLAALGLDTQPYVYAGNNPVNWTDPSGMLFISGTGSDGQVAIPTPSGACGRECPNSSGGGRKYTITVHCAKLHKGDAYYDDPHCKAWRTWYHNASTLQNTAVTSERNIAGNLYKAFGLANAFIELGLLVVDSPIEKIFDGIAVLSNLSYFVHGAQLQGDHSLDGLVGFLGFWLPLLKALGRFIQAAVHSIFAEVLIDAALAATPMGEFMFGLKFFMLLLGPVISGFTNAGLAAAYSEEMGADKDSGMSVEEWCIHYKKCGAEPDADFTAYS